ncbi:hypothetical protein [Acidocella sp.]|uniref:hypothetical protein n=1 Tax=Acidocella sp. TaxID=50710 RepID=UPI002633CC3F|nr:hypothetical protein [Acidocella sp.]
MTDFEIETRAAIHAHSMLITMALQSLVNAGFVKKRGLIERCDNAHIAAASQRAISGDGLQIAARGLEIAQSLLRQLLHKQ